MATDTIAGDRIRALAGHDPPGIVVCVVGPEGVRAAGAAGLADIAASIQASPRMVCPWLSVTKLVTATAAMRLAERGVLDLDAPVFEYVPALRQVQPVARAERITPRHLLSHSAGFSNPMPVRWVHPEDQLAPDPDLFLNGLLARHHRLRFEPGTRAAYSNLSPLVLVRAENRIHGSDQRSCSPGAPPVMITGHVPAVRVRHEALVFRMGVRDRPSPRRRSGEVKLGAA